MSKKKENRKSLERRKAAANFNRQKRKRLQEIDGIEKTMNELMARTIRGIIEVYQYDKTLSDIPEEFLPPVREAAKIMAGVKAIGKKIKNIKDTRSLFNADEEIIEVYGEIHNDMNDLERKMKVFSDYVCKTFDISEKTIADSEIKKEHAMRAYAEINEVFGNTFELGDD